MTRRGIVSELLATATPTDGLGRVHAMDRRTWDAYRTGSHGLS